MQPKVSVVISTYNRVDYLREAISSVQGQTFDDWELIVVDDASPDGTWDLLTAVEAGAPSVVRIERHRRNQGMVRTWQHGVELATGELIAKLDHDNRYLPLFLEKTVAALDSCPDSAFVFTDEHIIAVDGARDEVLTARSSEKYGRTALLPGPVPDPGFGALRGTYGINATVFRAEWLNQVGGFDLRAGNFADYALFLAIIAKGGRPYYLDERLSEYRVHPGNLRVSATTKSKFRCYILSTVTFADPAAESERLRYLETEYETLARRSRRDGRRLASLRASLKARAIRRALGTDSAEANL